MAAREEEKPHQSLVYQTHSGFATTNASKHIHSQSTSPTRVSAPRTFSPSPREEPACPDQKKLQQSLGQKQWPQLVKVLAVRMLPKGKHSHHRDQVSRQDEVLEVRPRLTVEHDGLSEQQQQQHLSE
jgi:hypothetical protein